MSQVSHIFAGRKTLIVTMREIKALLPMDECIRLQEKAFVASTNGTATNSPNAWLRPPNRNHWMKLMAGYVDDEKALGIKVLARFPKNPPGMNLGSIVALFDSDDGFPLAIMDGAFFTAIRTAAGGGLSAHYCARSNSTHVGILGSGVQARFNLVAVKQLMPQIRSAAVYSRSRENRREFASRMQAETGITITQADSIPQALEGADIVLTATNSPEPVLTRDLVVPGVHIMAMGIKQEIHPSVLQGARVIADGKAIALEDGKFALAVKQGYVKQTDLCGELGEVIQGKIPGRQSEEEVTFFDSSGLAVQDILCAQHVYGKARQKGLGTWVDLGLGEFP